MYRLLTFVIFTILTTNNIYSQKVSKKLIAEYEDTLQQMAYRILNEATEEKRKEANTAFTQTLTEVLRYENSFKFPFDSLKSISRVFSPDKRFRIFNWLLQKEDGSYIYYALVHHHNKKKKKYEIISLIDNSKNIRNPEGKILDSKNWFGSYYYEVIYIKNKGRKFYTLLGKDWNNGSSEQKIIDVMYFGGKNKIKFGLPIFKKEKIKYRVILEYDAKASVALQYSQKNEQIIFDHLVPLKEGLEGLYEYYVPNGTYDAYSFKDNNWVFEKDVDIRNKEKNKKSKKPEMGLIKK